MNMQTSTETWSAFGQHLHPSQVGFIEQCVSTVYLLVNAHFYLTVCRTLDSAFLTSKNVKQSIRQMFLGFSLLSFTRAFQRKSQS